MYQSLCRLMGVVLCAAIGGSLWAQDTDRQVGSENVQVVLDGWLVADNVAKRGISYSLVFYENENLHRSTVIFETDFDFGKAPLGRPSSFTAVKTELANKVPVLKLLSAKPCGVVPLRPDDSGRNDPRFAGPAGGVFDVNEDVRLEDLTFKSREQMLKDGGRNVPFPEIEAKRIKGQELTGEDKQILQKVKRNQENQSSIQQK